MEKYIAVAALISTSISCTDAQLSESEQSLGGATDCSVPDAVPDDGIDDRSAIQSALSSKGCALLGPGVYDIVTPMPRLTGVMKYAMLRLSGGMSLSGVGPATTLKFQGDNGLGDWHGVMMIGDDNEVTSLSFDTTALSNTDEQTHAIQILGLARRQKISGVWFNHPRHYPVSGDCIKVVGYDPTETLPDRRVSLIITANIFTRCDRSGIAIHSGVTDAAIVGNLFLATGDQDIDLEGGGGAIDNLAIVGNSFRRSLNPAGYSVAIGANLTRKATFANNVFAGGKVGTYNVELLSVTGNVFEGPGMLLDLKKVTRQATIVGNTFVSSGSGIYSTLKVGAHNSGMPGSIIVSSNDFKTRSDNGNVMNINSAVDVTVVGNALRWEPMTPASSTTAMIIYGIVQPTEAILVSSNVLIGPWTRALVVTNSYEATHGGGIRSVTFGGNIMRGPQYGLRCEVPGPGPLVSYGNSGAPNQCSVATSGN